MNTTYNATRSTLGNSTRLPRNASSPVAAAAISANRQLLRNIRVGAMPSDNS